MIYNNEYNLKDGSQQIFDSLDNYIYFYHLDSLLALPVYPSDIQDQSNIEFSQNIPMGRSAPIYSFTKAGPRSIQFTFDLRRDMMKQINMGKSNIQLGNNEDYVDVFIKYIQACAVPKYSASTKMIDPPIVAVKIEKSIFIKGVVSGGVGITWKLPMLRDNKYAQASVSFSVSEINPYSADDIVQIGSYRNPGDSKIPTISTNTYSYANSYNKISARS